jgi:UDP-N-acetylglucosamine:LPS N-acetylglucosamine transferase
VKKIDFIYFDAGGGHRAAAMALKSVIDSQNRPTGGEPWEVRLVNLQEVLDSLDIFRKITGLRLEDVYNKMLVKGWTLGSAQGLRFMHGVIRLYHDPTVRLLTAHWKDTQPDLVVSLVPNFNRALYQSLRNALPKVPYVTILTDFADYPPHFWMEAGQEQYFICGTEKAVQQARSLGHPDNRIFSASGMIMRPRFYDPVNVDRARERERLGLDPSLSTGLVLFGGQGSKVMLEISRRLAGTQLIFICGRNAKLAERLKALRAKAPRFIEGFTQEVPYYMALSDFFIGKPGPGSISEAVAMKLPVIVERNAWTLPQERYNAEWVRERHAGMVLASFRGIEQSVKELLASLDSYRESVARIENRAVFEIPEMLAEILEKNATLEGEVPPS